MQEFLDLEEAELQLKLERIKKLEVDTLLAKIKRDETLGRLVPLDVFNKKWAQAASTASASLRSIGSKLAPQLAGLDVNAIKEFIDVEINEVLTELSRLPSECTVTHKYSAEVKRESKE